MSYIYSFRLEADSLAETLKDNPLALVQAATYIKTHPSISIKDYEELFRTNRKELWEMEEKINHLAFDNYTSTVISNYSIISKAIKEESPEAIKLLAFCSFLNSKNIPKILLKNFLKNISTLDNLKQEETIATLIKYSLINHQEIPSNYSDQNLPKNFIKALNSTFTIHEMTQLAVHHFLTRKEKIFYLKQTIRALAQLMPDKMDIMIPLLEEANFLLSHLKDSLNTAENFGIYNNNIALLYIRELEFYLSGRRDFDKSQELITKIETILLKAKDISNSTICRFYLMKSVFYAWYSLNYKAGIDESIKALKLLDNQTIYNEEYLMAYNRLAQLYSMIGDMENALKYAKFGEDIINSTKEFLGNKDALFFNLAKIYMYTEQYEKAIHFINQAINSFSQRTEKGFIVADLPALTAEIEILMRAGQIPQAQNEASKLYNDAYKLFGNNNHLYMGTIMIFLGKLFFLNTQDLTEAQNLILEGQGIIKKSLEEKYYKNRYGALSHMFIGELHETKGENVRAQEEYSVALKIFNNIYDLEKVSIVDISDIYSKLAIINVKLKDPITAQKYFLKLQENFGYKHAKTMQVTNYFIEQGMNVGY